MQVVLATNMNYKLIYIFCMFRTIEVVFSIEYGFECVKRKSGACKAFNVTEDFDQFIDLYRIDYGDVLRITTIIEIDYMENKHSYELEKSKKKKEFDTDNSPVVDILFSETKDPEFSFRLVLGEKLNRLAYVEILELEQMVKYNNYSPDLPSWPFAINVTIDLDRSNLNISKLNVYTKNGDGFDKITPFLSASSDWIAVRYMSVRSRNKNVKLVGFYDCSTKYGFNCGFEKTQIITDCKKKFSPLGSGFFKDFVDMSRFNRLGKRKSKEKIFEYSEIFGIYRRNNDNMHIIFTSNKYESGTYIRITIGDEISVRVRTYNNETSEYYERTAVKKGWNQEPSEPNFINVTLSSVSKHISIYNLDDNEKPILTMKLCDYFDDETIRFMSLTSNRFNTVDLYYDCCLRNELTNCHVYNQTEINYNKTTDSDEIVPDSTTIRQADEDVTLELNGTDATMLNENSVPILPTEMTMESKEPTTEIIETTEVDDNGEEIEDDDDNGEEFEDDDDNGEEFEDDDDNETKNLKGEEKIKTFLDTRQFHETLDTLYIYANGKSVKDYCPNEIADVKLIQNTEANNIQVVNEEDPDISFFSNSVLTNLIG